jgi:hypothetical protein
MIRLSTCVTVLLACGSGLYLYQTKHQAQVLDKQIEHTVKSITATRMQTRELTASWTLLGSPDRLQQLSDQFLGIKSVLPSQFVAMSDLDLRLPAPRALDAPSSAAPTSATPGDTGSDTIPLATAEPTAAPDTPTTPAPTARAAAATPSPVAAADAARAPAVAAATAAAPIPATEPGKTSAVATARPAERKPSETPHLVHEVAPAHPTAPRPASPPSPVVAELERPAGPAPQRLAPAPQRLAPAPQRLAPAPMTGSLLGMAHIAVPAPVPLPVSTASSAANGN